MNYLRSTLETKVDDDGMFCVRLDQGIITNPMPLNGSPMKDFLDFYRVNSFRVRAAAANAEKASSDEDGVGDSAVFVLGEFIEHGPFPHTAQAQLASFKG